MRTALIVAASILLIGALAATAVYAWSAYVLLVLALRVMGGGA